VRLSEFVLACLALQLVACATPTRTDQMVVVDHSVSANDPVSLAVTVYGDDVGGFASHYYPLPRADFEKALLESLSNSGRFETVPRGGESDFRLSVGLIQLIQPQWSGTVTLETTWAISSAGTDTEITRKTVRVDEPASFSKKREATESVARETILEGMEWLLRIVDAASP
jgi:hypothetical protein